MGNTWTQLDERRRAHTKWVSFPPASPQPATSFTLSILQKKRPSGRPIGKELIGKGFEREWKIRNESGKGKTNKEMLSGVGHCSRQWHSILHDRRDLQSASQSWIPRKRRWETLSLVSFSPEAKHGSNYIHIFFSNSSCGLYAYESLRMSHLMWHQRTREQEGKDIWPSL